MPDTGPFMNSDQRPFFDLRLFLALSRTPHGVLDLATPIAAMLLVLGGFPSFNIVLLGLITVFAGYTAVYAVNDIADYKTDKLAFSKEEVQKADENSGYLDGVLLRHPLAQGRLTYDQAVIWAAFWGGLAFVGAWLLNPFCALLLILGVLFEIIYCKLLRVTWLRALVNGVVKTIGPLAAVMAVEPVPEGQFVLLLFLWVFFWEIGGQNIPADWHDIELDKSLDAKTIPVALGTKTASTLALTCIVLSVLLSVLLFTTAPLDMSIILALAAAVWGWRLIVQPAYRLSITKERADASALFNKASWYPAAMLLVILLSVLLDAIF